LVIRSLVLAVLVIGGCGGSASGGRDENCAKDDGNCFARNLVLTENGAAEAAVTVGTPCNTVANLGTDVLTIDVPGTPPAPTGGTLTDGFYVLTKREQFMGTETINTPSTETRSETIFVSNRGSTMQFVRRDVRGNRLVSISGSKITFEDKCPRITTSAPVDVSIVGSSIVIYETATILSTFSIAPSQPKDRPAITNKPAPITVKAGGAPGGAAAPPPPTAVVELAVTSASACRPVLCFGTLVKSGGAALTAGVQSRSSSCIRGPAGAPPNGNVKIEIGYAAPPQSSPQALGLQVFPATATDCATTDVAARLVNGDPNVVLGEAIVIDQSITAN